MSASSSVTTCVEEAVDPATAFAVFTDESGRWWRPGPINWYDSARAIDIRFEPGVGGRWLEIYKTAWPLLDRVVKRSFCSIRLDSGQSMSAHFLLRTSSGRVAPRMSDQGPTLTHTGG
jgi:hypothetical protein